MVVRTNKVHWFRAGAITVFPFIFVSDALGTGTAFERILDHENIHYEDQKAWCIWGLGIGLVAWFVLYLLVLPIGWNPFRWHWEAKAMRQADNLPPEEIAWRLRQPPYYLWWH
jgi:hypothetical protein